MRFRHIFTYYITTKALTRADSEKGEAPPQSIISFFKIVDFLCKIGLFVCFFTEIGRFFLLQKLDDFWGQ